MTTDVLCDIEGTIGSIAFVRDTLFPYARAHLAGFLAEHAGDPEVARAVADLARRRGFEPGDLRAATRVLNQWMDEDRKDTTLKALQGLVWARGYAAGDFRSHVYPDAARALQRWREAGLRLHVYSSGSVAAQKLYFRHSDHGDLRPLFIGWFDTATGPKTMSDSYATIASRLDVPPGQLLFLSDAAAELDAAAGAGLTTTWLLRPQDHAVEPAALRTRHPVAASFDEIRPAA